MPALPLKCYRLSRYHLHCNNHYQLVNHVMSAVHNNLYLKYSNKRSSFRKTFFLEQVGAEPVIQESASVMLKLMVPQKHGRRNAYTPPIEPRRCKTDLRALTPIGSHSEISLCTQYNESIASGLDQPEHSVKLDNLKNEIRFQQYDSPPVNCNNDGSALFHSQSYEHFDNPYKSLYNSNLRQAKSLQNISIISKLKTNENKSFSRRHTSSRTNLINEID